jgi:hypothetical protein
MIPLGNGVIIPLAMHETDPELLGGISIAIS